MALNLIQHYIIYMQYSNHPNLTEKQPNIAHFFLQVFKAELKTKNCTFL